MPTNLEYRARERQRSENERVGDRPAKLNEKKSDRDPERKIKTKETFFVGRTTKTFCRGGQKITNASGHQSENEQQRKKVNKNTYDISSIKGETRKFLEVSRYSRAKQPQRNVQKSVLHVESSFLLLRPIVVFSPFSLPSPHNFTRVYILFEQTIHIIGNFALLKLHINILKLCHHLGIPGRTEGCHGNFVISRVKL